MKTVGICMMGALPPFVRENPSRIFRNVMKYGEIFQKEIAQKAPTKACPCPYF